MLHICFRLAMGTLPQVRENDNAILFQKRANPLNRLFTWELSIPKKLSHTERAFFGIGAFRVIIVSKIVPDHLDQV